MIRTRVNADGDAEIEIADSGSGFPLSLLPRLGEPYVTSRASSGGTGLGLLVTHGLVTSHGGLLELRNADAGGAVVRITLPAHRAREMRLAAADSAVELLAAPIAPAVPAAAQPPLRILLVDDEPALLTVFARVLTQRGHLVTKACNGLLALQAIENGSFDLILSDLTMPECTGVELAGELELRFPSLRQRLIIMTGGAMTSEHAEFLSQTNLIFLEKPVRTHALHEAIARLVSTGPAAPALCAAALAISTLV